jgi:hypothetical protein
LTDVKFLDTIVAQLVKPSYVAAVQPLDGICADEGGAVHTAVEGVRLSDDPAVGVRIYATASGRVDPG